MAKATKKTSPKTSKNEVTEKPEVQEVTPEVKEEIKTETVSNENQKKELISEMKRIKRIINRTDEAIQKNRQKCDEWTKEGERLMAVNDQKFEADKVKKILQLKEEDNVDAIDVIIQFYQSEINRLSEIRKEKESSGISGGFSKEYMSYLRQRTERFEKRKSNINKSWIIYSENFLVKKIPPLEKKIEDHKVQLTKIEEQLAEMES